MIKYFVNPALSQNQELVATCLAIFLANWIKNSIGTNINGKYKIQTKLSHTRQPKTLSFKSLLNKSKSKIENQN